MLSTKEQRELDRLLEKQRRPVTPMTESDLTEIEASIVAVYDRAPDLFGDGMAAWRNFCANLDILAGQNDRLVREVRRLQHELSKTVDVERLRAALDFYACVDHYAGGCADDVVSTDRGAKARAALNGEERR